MKATDPQNELANTGYAICTIPRSGSNFLGQLLESTGCLGRPLEYFNGPARRVLDDPTFPDDPVEQILRIRTSGATPNGVYALKLFPSQHDLIRPHVSWTERLPNLHFIYLERRDVLGQAISWARAQQTGQYRSTQPLQATAAYDLHLIHARLLDVAREQARWTAFFARTGISPTTLIYEELMEDPQGGVRRIADLFGYAETALVDLARINLAIQRDEVVEEWRRRFVSEAGDSSYIDSF